MGTRADFYVGRGANAEWLGSISWDGYPGGIDEPLLKATTEEEFRAELDKFSARDDWTAPGQGWPWPWDDSQTTDYAYAFDGGAVHASCFGGSWFLATEDQPDDDSDEKVAEFPNMAERKNVAEGKRSGTIVVSVPRQA